MTMSFVEAGRLGGIKSREQKEQRILEYDLNPFVCLECKGSMPYEKRHNKFCSSSCSATYTNAKKAKEKLPCLFCGSPVNSKEFIYCSNKCQHDKKSNDGYNLLLENSEISLLTPYVIKGLLIKFEGNKCSVCGIGDWNDEPLKMELDHIDGNSDDNSYKNIRLICPNCHAQTSNYKNKNKGNGRAFRRQRYAEGKSY